MTLLSWVLMSYSGRYWSSKDGTVTEVDPADENTMEVVEDDE